MNSREYHLVAGVVILVASLIFFVLPALIPAFDPFLPVMIGIILLIISMGVLMMGLAVRTKK